MPPPINNQSGSKAALITWTVITSILFVVATVLAIFAQVERNKAVEERDTFRRSYEKVVTSSDLSGPLVQQIEAVKASNPNYSNSKLLNIVVQQRENLARAIAGDSVEGEANALAAAATALDQAKAAELKVQGQNLVSAVNAATAQIKALQGQITEVTAARDKAAAGLKEINESVEKQLQAKDADIAAARAQVAAFQGDTQTYTAEKDKQIAEIQSQADQRSKVAEEDSTRLQAKIQEMEGKGKQQQQVVDALRARLKDLRIPVQQIVKQSDASIIRVANDDIVYIDLGSGNQATPGLSFEVFSRLEGIPNPGDPTNNESLPKGKASIEIIKTSPGSSECRILRKTPGENLIEGDLCVNVVFDRNTKYNFLVYGNFDLDRNNQANAADADVIKRLVTSWGGQVVDKLTVDADFLVVGKVPEVPNYTPEELDTADKVYEKAQKEKELDEYNEVIARAVELNIPVLNQNRFLYFCGYYEQSGR